MSDLETLLDSPAGALINAIVKRLKGDSDVAEIVGEQVFDEVSGDKDGPLPPWVAIGPVVASDLNSNCGGLWTIRLRLFGASASFGRLQAWAIIHRAARALLRDELFLDPPFRLRELVIPVFGDSADPERVKSVFLDLVAVVSDSSMED